MRRISCLFLLVIILTTTLASCGRATEPIRNDIPAHDLMENVVGDLLSTATPTSAARGYVEVGEGYLSASQWGEDYAFLSDALLDYAVCISEQADMNIDEIGILRVADGYDVDRVVAAAHSYLLSQSLQYRDLLEAYNPTELPKTACGEVSACGQYVMYTLLDKTATKQAHAAFRRILTEKESATA